MMTMANVTSNNNNILLVLLMLMTYDNDSNHYVMMATIQYVVEYGSGEMKPMTSDDDLKLLIMSN